MSIVAAVDRDAVQEGSNVRDLRRRQRRELRHAGFRPAGLDHRRQQLAALIVEHDLRADQIRSAAIAAARVGAMTEGTVHAVQRFAALDCCGVGDRPLRVGDKTAAAATGGLLRTGRRILRSGYLTQQDGRRAREHQDQAGGGGRSLGHVLLDSLAHQRRHSATRMQSITSHLTGEGRSSRNFDRVGSFGRQLNTRGSSGAGTR